MKIPRHILPLALVLAALLPAATGLAYDGPPAPPVLFYDWYSFSNTNFDSDIGFPPIGYTNAISVEECWGNALLLDTTNLEPAFLNYRIIETNGYLNMDMGAGALFAIVVSDWASADTNQCGEGPGQLGYLLAAGDFSSGSPQGLWAIYVDAGGTNIYFGGVSNSVATTYVTVPISWSSNSIHEIGLTYTTHSMLYLDGQFAASGGPVTIIPATNTWTNGFYVGSDNAGFEQLRAIILYLECDSSNMALYGGSNWFIGDWADDTNSYYTWLNPSIGGFHPDSDGSGSQLPSTPTNAINTNYSAPSNFWLLITNTGGQAHVSLINPCLGLTYVIMTNATLAPITSTNWQPYVTLVGSNTIMPTPALKPPSNTLYFCAELVLSTGTNGLPDYWCMQYFGTLNVDPYADPDHDGLCNLTEYLLGTNPTNAYSLSSIHNDAQAMFLAYSYDPACRYKIAITNGPDTNTLLVTMWPTQIGTNYQIYSKDMSVTNSAWRLEQSFQGTNAATTVAISINGRNLSLIGGYGEDTDGDGLPDGYEVLATLTDPYLPDTGNTGVLDSYKDPDGDGYVNIVEYQNGTDPHVFNAPPAPTGFTVIGNNDGSATISWAPSPGNVTGYVIYRDTGSGAVPIETVSASQTSYHDTSLSPGQNVHYQIQVLLSGHPSSLSAPQDNLYNPRLNIDAIIVNGPSNRYYLVVPHLPPGVSNLLVSVSNADATTFFDTYLPGITWDYYPIDWERYSFPSWGMTPAFTNETFWIAPSALSNGVIQLSDAQVPLYGSYEFTVQAVGTNGQYGNANLCGGREACFSLWWSWFGADGFTPYLDGSVQMRQNISFLLRMATDQGACCGEAGASPFGYFPNGNPNWLAYQYPTNYVFASYYGYYGIWDPFIPFEDNYAYANFMFNASAASGGTCAGGVEVNVQYAPFYYIHPNLVSVFPTYNYAASGSDAPIPAILAGANSQWLFYNNISWWDPDGLMQNGLYNGNTYGTICMSNGAVNFYGLPYLSFQLPSTEPSGYSVISPGNCLSPQGGCVYAQVQPPELVTVDYYFARLGQYAYNEGRLENTYNMALGDPFPGQCVSFDYSDFSITNMTPLMIFPVGQPQYIGGWAKQLVTNAAPDIFAYLGQYFDGAYLVSNNIATTNPAGILSEYGMFYPMQPGQVALLTKPDPDQGNKQGTNIVDVIALQTDVNRDGVLDPTVTGPDFTTPNRPFRFWVNDNVDSGDDLGDGIPSQPVNHADGSKPYGYDVYGLPIYTVHGTRDLVDYFPVYVNIGSLFQGSNAINPTDTNYQLQLSQSDGALRFVYTTLTPTNFQNYMKDTNMAGSLSNAITTTITSGGVMLTNTFLSAIASNNGGILIVEAWRATTQPLVLDVIRDGVTIAETDLYLSISDVEQMLRQKNLTFAVNTTGQIDGPEDRLAGSDVPNEPDTNGTNFVFLSGSNINPNQARGWFADIYKRLFWSGSHARFYGVTWDGYDSQIRGIVTINLHTNVCHAFQTAEPLAGWLNTLQGANVVAAHSLGNMVVLSAISDWHAPVNRYFMIDAAVTMEGIDATTSQDPNLVHAEWRPYTNRVWATEWHSLFANSDARSTLTWRDRLANITNTTVFNFYSSGEEVLREWTNPPPVGLPNAVLSIASAQLIFGQYPLGSFLWCWQELLKGRVSVNGVLGSDHGGWRFNDLAYGTNQANWYYVHMSPQAAATLTTNQLQSTPFFDFSSDPDAFDPFTADSALTGSGGSSYARANQNRILADAIPALTLPLGANASTNLDVSQGGKHNYDMQTEFENGWPQIRFSTGEKNNNWHHSDVRAVAYTYTHALFDNIVTLGNLK